MFVRLDGEIVHLDEKNRRSLFLWAAKQPGLLIWAAIINNQLRYETIPLILTAKIICLFELQNKRSLFF